MFSKRSVWGVVAAILVAMDMVAISVSFSAPPTADRIDLGTKEGVAKVKGQWRFANVKIVEVPGLKPSTTTYDIDPKAQAADFDDSQWELVDPTTLGRARSTGKVCFCWYRIKITALPEWVGKKVELFTSVDDYGEVWVDGKLPFKVGQINGNLICGHNVPNHVELTDVKAGKIYQIAIFAINGPISMSPKNWIFLHDTYLQISPKAVP